MNINRVEQLLQDNKTTKALELLKELAMTQEVIKNYEVLSSIKQNLESYLSKKWNVSVKQIQDMSCQRFAESILFEEYQNKHFFNELNIRGKGCFKNWDVPNPTIKDYKTITEWLSKVYLKKEENVALDLLYVIDKKTGRVITSLDKSSKEIKDLRKSETASKELLLGIYYK
ncbi:hypothetical protein [Aliarcobacter butzleri]|uniref:hypothetical protein n=1 Tax=Aliarcobacter butzleri TaxID=28197 RepID=UPI0012698A33|nr:hypothetical protein [Aliarcobacter butzleri]